MDGEGYVDIFRIMGVNGKEVYVRVTDETLLDEIFEIFNRLLDEIKYSQKELYYILKKENNVSK